MTIPSVVHFCWIGPNLPWAYLFAILSAADHSGLQDIILHHTDALEEGPVLQALRLAPGISLSRTDPILLLTEVGQALALGDGLAALYRHLERPTMRADLLRAAILYQRGGVYLDLDTITTASLLPLLDVRHFVGTEFIVWPKIIRESGSPTGWARQIGLDLLRKALRLVPGGWKAFRKIENFYFLGVNNAVMGSEIRGPLFADYLRAMLTLPPEFWQEAYALGPDLLQDIVGGDRAYEVTIHPPPVFYPLPPEISEHWFRRRKKADLGSVLPPETRVVHWYASVRSKPLVAKITPDYVRLHRDDQFYSALVWSSLSASLQAMLAPGPATK